MKNNSFASFAQGEIILITKPYKWTSFDVVNKVRFLLKSKLKINAKVGHAGTLDPLATGLLLLCTGKFTKKIHQYQDQEKEYTGTFFLGATTPSFDLETSVDAIYPLNHITDLAIHEAAFFFIGELDQVPPLFSAIKIGGERAYEKARRGEITEIKSRKVKVFEFEIVNIELPLVTFRIVCSKGTYIRSLVRDLGLKLHSGAYLASLCRTRIGDFKNQDALDIIQFEQIITSQMLPSPVNDVVIKKNVFVNDNLLNSQP